VSLAPFSWPGICIKSFHFLEETNKKKEQYSWSEKGTHTQVILRSGHTLYNIGMSAETISFVFIASQDEPAGIPDDFFLLRALTQRRVSFQYRLWTDPCKEIVGHHHGEQQVVIRVIRSLWQGRSRQGISSKLLQFFAHTADLCPCMRHDYLFLAWTTHKSYLLHLQEAGVDIVPTCLLPASSVDKQGASHAPQPSHQPPQQATEPSSPGDVKRAMTARGWSEAILKPAVGTRCEGVMQLSLQSWSLPVAFAVATLLKEGDCILQPFLPPIAASVAASDESPTGEVKKSDQSQRHCDKILLGEVCVLCIDGEIAHAIHKNPSLWGWHESSCGCAASSVLALKTATCTCRSISAPSTPEVVSNISLVPAVRSPDTDGAAAASDGGGLPPEVAELLKRAPVDGVVLPLPAALVDTVKKVLEVIRKER
jgi:hypothetical protein